VNDYRNENKSVDVCEDCGAVAAEGKAGCLKLFEEVIAREFSDYSYGKIHRLTVDAYSLQHAERYMRSGKSFAAHLTGIYAALESEDAVTVNQKMRKWLDANPKIEKPVELPRRSGKLTIAFVHNAADADEHCRRVREWAQEVWSAWREHHALAKQLIDSASGAGIKR
jgi:hypothetical protein